MELRTILPHLDHIKFIGDASQNVDKMVRIYEALDAPDVISWCSDKNLDLILKRSAGTIICSEKALELNLPTGIQLIVTQHPRSAFRQLLLFYESRQPKKEARISETARIHPSVRIGEHVSIGEHTVIEEGCVIGDHVHIGHNNVILRRTHIDAHVKIGQNNTIGSIGFGYEKNETGTYELIPHLGNVHIMERVEIGNNTCIDRAVIGSTLIKKQAKIDNLVHISHGVTVGENSLVIAHAMVAGSVHIGENVWVAPASSILNGTSIADDAVIGMGAVVLKPVQKNQVVVGNPAKPLERK